jgi:hypothetical protein
MKIPMTCLVLTIALAGCGGETSEGGYVDMLAPIDEANVSGVTADPSFAGCVGHYRNFEPRAVDHVADGAPCHHDISDYATRRVFLR